MSVWVRKNSSRSNSRLVSPTGWPPTVTDRAAVDTVSSPTVISNGTVDGGRRRAAQHRTHPQREFARTERFGQVVVGAGLQSGDAVVLLAECGQQDHRHGVVAALAQRPAQRQSAGAGHHHVEHGDVDPLGAEHPQRLIAVPGHPHLEPVALEVAPDDIAHDGVVVGDQNPGRHGIRA